MSTPVTATPDQNATPVADLLKVQAARLFFERGLTKQEIGERLHISRFKAARLVEQAIAEGLVQFNIRDVVGFRSDLALALEDRFGLKQAIVAAIPADGVSPRDCAAAAAAKYLDDLLYDGCKLGVAWGTTLNEVAARLVPRRKLSIEIMQLVGGFSEVRLALNAIDICRRIADLYGGAAHLLHAPAVLGSVAARDVLAQEPGIRATLDRHRSLDAALVGIGAINPPGASALVAAGAASEHELAELRARGIVGDLFGHFYTADGRVDDGPLTGRMIAITPDDALQIPVRIGVAAGMMKTQAIRATLTGQLVNVLVTDEQTAMSIMESDG